MISVCIPIYNFDVSTLVHQLENAKTEIKNPVEFIFIDDGSQERYKSLNAEVCNKHNYIELNQNIGRAAIRNRFIEYASFEHLLFLDCDSLIPSADFLKRYIDLLDNDTHEVICGGRIYPDHRPDRSKRLRWKYGVTRESQPALIRNAHPNRSFMTNNFLIDKKLFSEIRFDENLKEYGHEDTLFGYALRQKGIPIHHIDNPVLNNGLETNEEFLHKTEQGINSLIYILNTTKQDQSLINDIALAHMFFRWYNYKGIIKAIFWIIKPCLRFFLLRGTATISMFSFYKLGLLASQSSRLRKT